MIRTQTILTQNGRGLWKLPGCSVAVATACLAFCVTNVAFAQDTEPAPEQPDTEQPNTEQPNTEQPNTEQPSGQAEQGAPELAAPTDLEPGTIHQVGQSTVHDATDEGIVAAAPLSQTTVTVRVVETAVGEANRPIADAEIQLHLVLNEHEILQSLPATTDASGEAVFEIEVRPGTQAVAQLTQSNGSQFSDPIAIDGDAEGYGIELSLLGSTTDPSALFVSNLMTILELWEEHVVVTQVWIFGVDQPVVFDNVPRTQEEMNTITPEEAWLRVEVPMDAEGVRVQQPDLNRVVDNNVYFATRVAPADGEQRTGPNLILRYSLPRDHGETVTLDQPMLYDVSSVSVVVPQTTEFDRYPRLSIDVDAPLCDDPTPGLACFAEIREGTDNPMVQQGVEVRVASSGVANAGDRLFVTTTGWPTPLPWLYWVAIAAGLCCVVLGGVLYRHVGASRPDGDQEVALLLAQRRNVLREARELERAYAEGRIMSREHERVRERQLEELGVIERRLRECGSVEHAA